MRKALVVLLSALFVAALSGASLAEKVSGGGVTLNPPAGWTQAEASQGAVIILFSPDSLSNFRPNVNVLIQQTGKMGYEAYRDITAKQTKQMSGSTSGYRRIKLNDGSEAAVMNINFKMRGQKLSTLSVWTMQKGKTYLVNGTTVASDMPSRRNSFLEIAKTLLVP